MRQRFGKSVLALALCILFLVGLWTTTRLLAPSLEQRPAENKLGDAKAEQNAKLTASDAASVAQVPGSTSAANLAAKSETGSGSIFGSVSDGKQTVPGVKVSLIRITEPDYDQYRQEIVAETQSLPDGSFSFKQLPNGTYSLFAIEGKRCSFSSKNDLPRLNLRHGAQLGPVTLLLKKGQEIGIQVLSALTDKPIPHAVITVTELGQTTRSDDQGLARLTLGPADWAIETRANGFAQLKRNYVIVDGVTTRLTIRLNPGQQLKGRVFGPSGPCPNAWVSISNAECDLYTNTNAEGYFQFEGVPIGERVSIKASAPGHDLATAMEILPTPPPFKEIYLTIGSNEEDGQTTMSPVSGYVIDAFGDPIEGALIECNDQQTYTDANGHYQFKKIPYVLITASAEGYAPSAKFIQEPTCDFKLQKGFRFEGRVQDPEGQPLARVEIQPESRNLYSQLATYTDQNGAFVLENVANGMLFIFGKQGYFSQPHQIETDAPKPQIIVLKPGLNLAGRLIDAVTHKPIATFKFNLSPSNEPYYGAGYRYIQHPQGQFLIEGITENPSTLTLKSEGYSTEKFHISGTTLELEREFKLQPGTLQLNGVVLDERGEPIVGCHLTLDQRAIKEFQEVTTDEHGYFEIKNISQGNNIWVSFHKKGFIRKKMNQVERLMEQGQASLTVTLQSEKTIAGEVNLKKYPTALSVNDFKGGSSTLDADGKFKFTTSNLNICRLFLLGPNNSTLETLTIHEVEGSYPWVRFGDKETFQVKGFVYSGNQPYQGHVLLKPHQDGPDYTALLDPTGFFSQDNLAPGNYTLYIPPKGMSASEDSHLPNPFELEVYSDIDQVWQLPEYAQVFGSIQPPEPHRTLNLSSDSFTQLLETPPSEHFTFQQVPPGQYQLEVFDYSRSTKVFETTFVMPSDGSDFDLGTIEIRDNGKLKIRQLNAVPKTNSWLRYRLYSSGEHYPNISMPLFFDNHTYSNSNLPEGPAILTITSEHSNVYAIPSQFQVDLNADTFTELETTLTTLNKIMIHTSSTLRGADLKPNGGKGTAQIFIKASKPIGHQTEPGLYFFDKTGVAVLDAEGAWTLSLYFEDGKTVIKDLNLKFGENLSLKVNHQHRP